MPNSKFLQKYLLFLKKANPDFLSNGIFMRDLLDLMLDSNLCKALYQCRKHGVARPLHNLRPSSRKV